MDIFVLNESFEAVGIVDSFISFIWTDRYCYYGDFELVINASQANMELFKQDYYIQILESDRLMIIESIQIDSDVEYGDKLTIQGRSLESILERRIVWGQITFEGNKTIQYVVNKLLTDAFMTSGERYISNFAFEFNNALLSSPVLNSNSGSNYGAQFTGDGIYDIITNLCVEHGLGFKIILTDADKIEFSLYKGIDRSYDNSDGNPFVVFSKEFDNIMSSNYIESKRNLKTVALVAGEGEGSDRIVVSVGNSNTGMKRRELFVDARDLSSTSYNDEGEEVILTDDEYASILANRGIEKLSEFQTTVSFEGQVEARRGFIYGKDFFLGDIVELVDKFGHEQTCRVTEVVVSYTKDQGYTIYPTFELLNKEE